MNKIKTFSILFLSTLFIFGSQRVLKFEDMFSVKRISSVSISPNGKTVVFSIKVPDIEKNSYKTDIYITDIDRSIPTKITDSKGNNIMPFFVTSSIISFLSSRNGDYQIFTKNLTTGKVEKISNVPGGVDSYIKVPMKDIYAFQKDVFPSSKTLQQSIEKEKVIKESGLEVKVLNSLMFRVWNQWKNGKRSHIFLTGNNNIDLTSGDFDTPPVDLGGEQDFLFSPDGKKFAYVKNTDKMVAISTNNDIFLKDMETGNEENLTVDNRGADANPVFSPSGRYLAYISMKQEGFEADKHNIIMLDLINRKKKNLTGKFKFSVNSFIFSPKGNYIYFNAYESVYHPVFRIRLKDGSIKKIVSSVFSSDLNITPDGKKLLFLNQGVTFPAEIFTFDLRRKKLKELMNLNGDIFKNVKMNKIEIFNFKGAGGDNVEGILVKPPFFKEGEKYPMVFLIHGGPQGAWGDDFHYRWNQSLFASPGYVVASINFHGSRGYGQAFTNAVSKDWGGAPFKDLVIGQKYLIENYKFIDKNRIVAAGASYGGFMINWIAGNYDKFEYPFRCLVSHDGIFDSRSMYYSTEELWFEEWEHGGTPWQSNLFEKFSPSRFVEKFKIPILIVHGQKDFRVPVSQGLMLFTAYQRRGIESKMLYFPDEDHFVQKPKNARFWWKSVFKWFKEHITN